MDQESTNLHAPYAPPSNVIAVIDNYRENAPTVIDLDLMGRLGMEPTYGRRALSALIWLGLIDKNGKPLDSLIGLQRASTDDFPEKLAEVIRVSYRMVFETVNPDTATDQQIEDAFRSYKPAGQRTGMIRLFMNLCQKAGLVHSGRTPNRRGRTISKQNRKKTVQTLKQSSANKSPNDNIPANHPANDNLIVSVLEKLPSSGTWTEKEKNQWLQAFNSSLDIVVMVTSEQKAIPERSSS